MKNLNLDMILLFVKNPMESASFYSKLFDIKPVEQSPTFVMFVFPNGLKLGLWSRYTAEPRIESAPGAADVCFPVDDVDTLYEAWGKKGVVVVQKPTDMDFGRTFVIHDLDGHRIRIYKFHHD